MQLGQSGEITVGPRLRIPAHAFMMPLAVRSYEVTAAGCITPGTVLRYLEHVATLASAERGFDSHWYTTHGGAWVVHEMQVRFGRLPGIADELLLATWVAEFRRVQAQRDYAIWHASSGRLVARASARWAYVDRLRGQPARIPPEIVDSIGVFGAAMPPLAMSPRDALAAQATLQLTARGYESDTQQHINNCVYVDWLDEALRRAVPNPHTGETLLPRTLRIEYARPVLAGETVEITTTRTPLGRRASEFAQEVRHAESGALAVRAWGRYLNAQPTESHHGEHGDI